MTVAIGILFAALAAAFVAWPFLQKEESEPVLADPSAARDEDRRRIENLKLEAYGAIRDAELDYHTGKLSDADFQALKTKYEQQALQAIDRMEQMRTGAQVERRGSSKFNFCPACGNQLPRDANFCPSCGAGFPATAIAA